MPYINRALSDEEKLLILARPHWIYLVQAVFWCVLCAYAGFWLDDTIYRPWAHETGSFEIGLYFITPPERFTPFSWVGGFLGLILFWTYFSIYISNEVGLTNQRYIHKKGLLFVTVEQVDLEDVRAEDVHHGLLGWLFRYGSIHLDALFTEDLYLPAIAQPYPLLRAAHKARAHRPRTTYDKEELEVNLERLDTQEKASMPTARIKALHDRILRGFKRAA